MSQIKNTVLFHANCTDGLVSAFLMKLYFDHLGEQDQTEFIAVNYGQPLPPIRQGTSVYIVDFSYAPAQVQEMLEAGMNVTMLDHHETAAKMYGGYCEDLTCETHPQGALFSRIISKQRAGCLITYDWVCKRCDSNILHKNERLKWLVSRVSDRDLWKFNFSDSTRVHTLVNKQRPNFEWLEKIVFQLSVRELEEEFLKVDGVEEFRESEVQNYASKHTVLTIMGARLAVVNVPSDFASSVGDRLVKTVDCDAALLWTASTDKVFISLRALPDKLNVCSFAELFGGGGHASSSGMSMRLAEFSHFLRDQFELLGAQYQDGKVWNKTKGDWVDDPNDAVPDDELELPYLPIRQIRKKMGHTPYDESVEPHFEGAMVYFGH